MPPTAATAAAAAAAAAPAAAVIAARELVPFFRLRHDPLPIQQRALLPPFMRRSKGHNANA
jgi:hypothetical protein